ncbi:hypothetical protein MOQ_008540 [Trypanosoma cruzi marinkellei]|uniref:Uncharacterized protein n=1 Tax=Trypanosoma cruzi marinkellei TaxID=85056 RepID=K2NFE8_TRYCR|nr:hypothetical protein MOQ_008540 [Trypanosoma cruzi marinkellei]
MSDRGIHSQSPPHNRSVGRQGSTRLRSSRTKQRAQRETAPMAMPATSPWCQGQLPRILGGSQQPAVFPSRDCCCWCRADGINQRTDQPRLAGTRLQHHEIWGHVLYRTKSWPSNLFQKHTEKQTKSKENSTQQWPHTETPNHTRHNGNATRQPPAQEKKAKLNATGTSSQFSQHKRTNTPPSSLRSQFIFPMRGTADITSPRRKRLPRCGVIAQPSAWVGTRGTSGVRPPGGRRGSTAVSPMTQTLHAPCPV